MDDASPAMRLLLEKAGKPPYDLATFTRLRQECLDMAAAFKSGTVPQKDAIAMFEMMDLITWTAVWGTHSCCVPELRGSSVTIDGQLWTCAVAAATLHLRQSLFDCKQLPPLTPGGLCQSCNWTLARSLGQFRAKDKCPFTSYQLSELGFGWGVERFHILDLVPDLDTLERRVLQECKLCSFLADSMYRGDMFSQTSSSASGPNLEPVGLWLQVKKEMRGSSREKPISVQLWSQQYLVPSSTWSRKPISMVLTATDDSSARRFGLPLQWEELEPLSPTNLAFIHKYLSLFADPMPDPQYCPKRLLDLGPSKSSTIRMVELSQNIIGNGNSATKYATLSYRWGSPEDASLQLKLLPELEDEFRQGISLAKLTPVQRDAVVVCRALDIRYIWIDSLCIIQGSAGQADWEEQCYEMDRIYGNSWLTICALASNSCLEGFLEPINRQSPSISFEVMSDNNTATQNPFHLRLLTNNGKPHSAIAASPPVGVDMATGTWEKRGWVFSERLLSPRKLLFGGRMIHFERGRVVYSENGDSEGIDLPALDSMPPEYCPSVTNFWYQVVPSFPLGGFTNSSDVLPALSGLAKVFQALTSYQYLAGLWAEDLHCGLLWKHETQRATPRNLTDLANKMALTTMPSWSWARLTTCRPNGWKFLLNASYHSCRYWTHLRSEMKYISAVPGIKGRNPLGCVKNASITIRSRVLELSPEITVKEAGLDSFCLLEMPASSGYCFVWCDWQSGLLEDFTGRGLALLPLASCCTDPEYQTLDEVCHGCEECFTVTSDSGSEGDSHTCRQCGHSFTAKYQSLSRENYDYEKWYDSAVPLSECTQCAETEEQGHSKRDIWGILVLPVDGGEGDGTENTGQTQNQTYYRVGVFMSRAAHGGSNLFRHAEERTVILK